MHIKGISQKVLCLYWGFNLSYSSFRVKSPTLITLQMYNISCWGGRSVCHPWPSILLSCSPSILKPILPFSQHLSGLSMGRRQVCHKSILINLQRLCFKALKTHLVVVVAVKSILHFASESSHLLSFGAVTFSDSI